MSGDPPPPRPLRRMWQLGAASLLLLAPAAVVVVVGVLALLAAVAAVAIRRARAAARLQATVAAAHASGGESIVLGADATGAGVALSDRALAAHGLIVGASGAGKTTTLLAILAAQIRRGRPVVAIDLKGSPAFAGELRSAALAVGRPMRTWSLDGPERWNPVATGNATELKDKLIATERFTEPHYQRAAERYVQLALQAWLAAEPGVPVTLPIVVELLEPGRLGALARRLEPEAGARLSGYLGSLGPDQLSAVRGLASRLAVIAESHTGSFLVPEPSARAIDLRAALAGEEVILFSLNSSIYGQLAAQLGTLAVQDLVTAAGARLDRGGVPPATVAIDEFSALGADHVLALIARGREAGIGVLLATQELADLDRAARGLREQVLGNSAVKIAHRQDVPESAAAVARMTGTVRVWERSYGQSAWGGADPRRGSLRLTERNVVEAERVRTLGTGEAVVIVSSPAAGARLARVIPPPSRGGVER